MKVNKLTKSKKNQFICNGYIFLKSIDAEELCGECDHSKPHDVFNEDELNKTFGINKKATASSPSAWAQDFEQDFLQCAKEAADELGLSVDDIMPPMDEVRNHIKEIIEPCTKIRVCNPGDENDLECQKNALKVRCEEIK